jgi:hypothetical protein
VQKSRARILAEGKTVPSDADGTVSRGSAVAPLPAVPLGRLRLAVQGTGEVRRDDLQALLTGHLLDANSQAKVLGSRLSDLLQMLFDSGLTEADPGTLLRLMARLSSLYGEQLRELRRTAELLHRMSCPTPPTLQVVNAINVGGQRPRPVALGEGRRARR